MWRLIPFVLYAILWLGAMHLVPLPKDEKKNAEQAMALVGQVLQALEAKDVNSLMKLADVPWLDEEYGVVRDRNQLPDLLQRSIVRDDTPPTELEILNVFSYSRIRARLVDETGRKDLDAVLGKDGMIIVVFRKESIARRYLLVRLGAWDTKLLSVTLKIWHVVHPDEVPVVLREALEKSESLELLSLDPFGQVVKDGFHDWRVLGKTVVKDRATRKKLLLAFRKGVADIEDGPAFCFEPRHGIRVAYSGKTVELVICFACRQVQVYLGSNGHTTLWISTSPQPVFDEILRDADVPLP